MIRLTTILVPGVACCFAAAVVVSTSGCGSARRAQPLVGPVQLSDQEQLGRQVFSQHCYQCHPNGDAGAGPAINDKPLPQALIRTQVRAGLGAMPAFDEAHISDDDLKALSAYLAALRKSG